LKSVEKGDPFLGSETLLGFRKIMHVWCATCVLWRATAVHDVQNSRFRDFGSKKGEETALSVCKILHLMRAYSSFLPKSLKTQ
jgi:hypothetical protein